MLVEAQLGCTHPDEKKTYAKAKKSEWPAGSPSRFHRYDAITGIGHFSFWQSDMKDIFLTLRVKKLVFTSNIQDFNIVTGFIV